MTEQPIQSNSILPTWSIPVYAVIFALLGLSATLFKESPAPLPEKRQVNPFTVSSGAFKEEVRHLKDSDKAPVLQWIERARLEGKIRSRCVKLIKEKGSNATAVLPELAGFLSNAGYQVSTDSASVKLPVELLGLKFIPERDCVTVHLGLL